jgi:hypothetical protein
VTKKEQRRIAKMFNLERDRYLKWRRGERELRVDGFRRRGGVKLQIGYSQPIELSPGDVRKLITKLRKWLPRKRRKANLKLNVVEAMKMLGTQVKRAKAAQAQLDLALTGIH